MISRYMFRVVGSALVLAACAHAKEGQLLNKCVEIVSQDQFPKPRNLLSLRRLWRHVLYFTGILPRTY